MTLSQKAIDYAKQRGLTIGSGESKPSKLLFKDPSVNEEFNQLRPDLKSITETNPYGGRITSGYRDEQQNEAVGGVPNSYHTKGLAVDIGLDDLTDKRIAYYKSKGLNPILESDHLHVEPPSDDWRAPVQQRSQTGLSQRAKAYAKERGLSYPGMETEPKTDTIQPKEEPSFLQKADYPGLLKSIGRGALVTAGQMADPALELAKRFNPTALGNEAVKAMGGIPVSNKYVDEPIDYLRGIAQKAAQTPLTEYEQNKGIDVTAPIAKRWPEYAQRGVEGIASGLGLDPKSKPVQAAGGATGSLAEILQSFTSPTNIASLSLAGLPNAAQKIAAGAFAPMMLKGSEEGFNRGMEGFKTGNVREAAAGLTSGVASAGLAGAAGMGALAEKPSMQQISDAMKARPMEFLDYPDPTGAAKFDVPQLTAPKIKVAPREYIPEGKSKTYTSEPISALKKEPYNVKTLVEETPIEQRVERPIEPQPLKVREKPLFPFIPEELAIEKEVPNPLQNLPTAVQPKEQAGFTGTLKTIKKIEEPYPTSYKAEATTPETLKTLDTQVKAMKAKKVPAVLVTPGEMTPKMAKGMMTLDTDVGKWIYDPMRINKQEILSKVEDGTYGEILGHVEPKSPKATQTVAAIMPDGTEAKTSIVSPENVNVQSQILKQQFPKAEIKVGGEELAGQVLDQRNKTNIEAKEGLKSRVYERVQQEYPEILKDDVRYEKLTLKDDIAKASDLLEKDPNRLYEIANDFDNRNEVNSTIANIVLSDKALRDGNHELYADLIKRRSLALTEKGQDISAEKASVNDNSTSKYVKQLLNERASQLSDTLKTADFKSMKKGEKLTKVLKDESAALKQKINKSMDLKAAQDIFDKLKCV